MILSWLLIGGWIEGLCLFSSDADHAVAIEMSPKREEITNSIEYLSHTCDDRPVLYRISAILCFDTCVGGFRNGSD